MSFQGEIQLFTCGFVMKSSRVTLSMTASQNPPGIHFFSLSGTSLSLCFSPGEGALWWALLQNLGLCWVIWGVVKEVELRSRVGCRLEEGITRLGIWIHLNWEGGPTGAEAVTGKDTAVTSLLEYGLFCILGLDSIWVLSVQAWLQSGCLSDQGP